MGFTSVFIISAYYSNVFVLEWAKVFEKTQEFEDNLLYKIMVTILIAAFFSSLKSFIVRAKLA